MSYTNKVGKIYNKKGFSKISVGLYQFDIHRGLRMERIRNKLRIREKRTGEKIQDWSREKQRSVQKGKYKFTRCKKVGAS